MLGTAQMAPRLSDEVNSGPTVAAQNQGQTKQQCARRGFSTQVYHRWTVNCCSRWTGEHRKSMLSAVYPNPTAFIGHVGWIKIGCHAEKTRHAFVRAMTSGGVVWEGKDQDDNIEDALQDVENGIEAWRCDTGIA